MKNLYAAILRAGLASVLLAGCGGTVTAPPDKISRYYRLSTVDARNLPFTLSSTATSITTLEGGSLSLNDSVYTRSLVIRDTYPASPNKIPLTLTYSESGTFVLRNTTIDFLPISGNGLQLNWNRRAQIFPSVIDYVEDAHNYEFQIQ